MRRLSRVPAWTVNNLGRPDHLLAWLAKYYTPNGKAIQDSAVTPNVMVADNQDDVVLPDEDENAVQPDQELKKIQRPPQQDEKLRRAIEVLKNRPA